MANGEPPVERRPAPRTRKPASERPAPRKSPARPRKAAASSSTTTVADRIDPLMAAASAEAAVTPRAAPRKRAPRAVFEPLPKLEQPAEAETQSNGSVSAKPTRPKQPAPRKRAPAARRADPPAVQPLVPEVTESPTAELQVFDDLVVFEDPVLQKTVAEDRVEALVPYVLPKIIPGEPDTVPDESPGESPVALVETEPDKTEPDKTEPDKTGTVSAFKPKVLRLTKKLAHSLQPVIVPRHRPRVRRVTRVLRHVDTWSVFKIALLFNIFLYAVCLTAGAMLWRVAVNTGTIENVERFFESFGWQTFELKGGEIYHNAWIAGLFGVVGLTGLAVLAATVFNLITDLVGGVRVTVLEEEVIAREQRVVTWPRLLRPPPPSRDEPPID